MFRKESEMHCMCSPPPPVKDGFCVECGQPAVGNVPPLTADQILKMTTCGNCDRDQENLCDDCPSRMNPFALEIMTQGVTFPSITASGASLRRSELFPILTAGRMCVKPNPVIHDQPQPQETARDHARRLLRLKSKQDNVVEIMTMIPETLSLLTRLWESNPSGQTDKARKAWIASHPFTKYLTHLLRIRTLGADASYLQAERVMEGIAEL